MTDNQIVKTMIEKLNGVREIQGRNGTWNYSRYMHGLYNGIELSLAIIENREAVYKGEPEEGYLDHLEPEKDAEPSSLDHADRYEIAWRIWCWKQGYGKEEDRLGLWNHMRHADSELSERDVEDKHALLAIADDILASLR